MSVSIPARITAPSTRPAPHHDLAALKRANPLARVARAYGLDLRAHGAGRLVAFCPFHDDRRTPNFVLDLRDPDDEHFHCYAGHCRAHGDVLDLVMRLEGVDLPGACALLAGSDGPIDRPMRPATGPPDHAALPPAPRRSGANRSWERLTVEEQTVMNLACAVYRRALRHEVDALRYLHGRGLPPRLLRRCALGWADGHTLAATLRREHDPRLLPLAVDLGLLRRTRGGGLRDALAGRVVVPELRAGHAIWFIGRGLGADGGTPHATQKYLALPGERPTLGQRWATCRDEAFACEGVFDWLAALALGLSAWCACGTHVPTAGLGFLARTRRVYGVFDGDAAGRAASARLALALGERYRPLSLPEDRDLSALLGEPGGPAHFRALLAEDRIGDGAAPTTVLADP